MIDHNLFLTRYIFKCTGTTIKINGKVNAITLDNCKKVLVLEKWWWIDASCDLTCCSHSTFVTWVLSLTNSTGCCCLWHCRLQLWLYQLPVCADAGRKKISAMNVETSPEMRPEDNIIIFQISVVLRSIWWRKVFDHSFSSPRCWARWTPSPWRRQTAVRCSSTRLANGEFKIMTATYS